MEITAFPTQRVYRDEKDFYADGVLGTARKFSREIDHGVWWRDSNNPHPVYRVSYVLDSNEVVAVCLGGKPREQVEVIASGVPEERLEGLLEGWGEVCGQNFSLQWVRACLRDYPTAVLTP